MPFYIITGYMIMCAMLSALSIWWQRMPIPCGIPMLQFSLKINTVNKYIKLKPDLKVKDGSVYLTVTVT